MSILTNLRGRQRTSAKWPEGVITRYLTVGGALVNVWEASKRGPEQGICSGCKASTRDGGLNSSLPKVWAQEHAERCRAIPKPDGPQ